VADSAYAEPLARSPIAVAPPEVVVSGWLVSGRASRATLTITDCAPLTKVAVRASYGGGPVQALGVTFGRIARQDWSGVSVLLVGSGPGEWLALGPPGTAARLVEGLGEALEQAAADLEGLVTVVDVTHGRAMVRITGVEAASLLAKECAIDLGARGDGTAFRTGVAGVATDVVRDDRAGTPSYLLHCERSSGQYLYDALLDAGAEFGIEADGFGDPLTRR
jgi:sarcosine oxidase, subunit gamma